MLLKVSSLPNPLLTPPWSNISKISINEISQYIDNNILLSPDNIIRNKLCSREEHISRIAYLIINPDYKSITIFKRKTVWPIKDGNHRLAAAIYRKDIYIKCHFI